MSTTVQLCTTLVYFETVVACVGSDKVQPQVYFTAVQYDPWGVATFLSENAFCSILSGFTIG